jgi:hypothetical protein
VPPTWVKRRVRTKGNEYDILHNGSHVMFKHIHDPVKGRQHIASLNVSHILVDQAEEMQEEDFLKLLPRTRYRPDLYHSMTFAFNPAGHNWLWRRLYSEAKHTQKHPHITDWDWLYIKQGSLGIAVKTEENTPKYGGYLPQGFYETLRQEFPPEWQARYLDCSFEEFEGKVYPRYDLHSAHNIDTWNFPIGAEDEYDFGVGIDVGGSTPWAIVRIAIDKRWKRVFAYDEFYKPNASIREVASWIMQDPHWRDARIVIDYENRPVMLELSHFGIVTIPARKGKSANIMRVNTYMNKHPLVPHPVSGDLGAPRFYVTANCQMTRKEHDIALWKQSDTGENKPDPKQPDHARDAVEYILAGMPYDPTPTQPVETKLQKLWNDDPGAASMWEAIHKRDEKVKHLNQQEFQEYEDLSDLLPASEFYDHDPDSEKTQEIFFNWE